jgi:dTDP-4-amino-4,6-dideoxygalactose transaminase
MMALGLQPVMKCINTVVTYIATTEVVALLRLKPVFVDVDPQTFCMDPKSAGSGNHPPYKSDSACPSVWA